MAPFLPRFNNLKISGVKLGAPFYSLQQDGGNEVIYLFVKIFFT